MSSKPSAVTDTKNKRTKKQWALFIAGLIAIIMGISILGFYGIRKISREVQKQKLMNENVVLEIADLKIKAPVIKSI